MITRISFSFIFVFLIGFQSTSLELNPVVLENGERTEEILEREVEVIVVSRSFRLKKSHPVVPSIIQQAGAFMPFNSKAKLTTISSLYPSPLFNHFKVLRS